MLEILMLIGKIYNLIYQIGDFIGFIVKGQ